MDVCAIDDDHKPTILLSVTAISWCCKNSCRRVQLETNNCLLQTPCAEATTGKGIPIWGPHTDLGCRSSKADVDVVPVDNLIGPYPRGVARAVVTNEALAG